MAKRNADTSHMSHEEISKLDLHGSKRPPGSSRGNVLHQTGGGGLRRAASYPVTLAGVMVLVGVGSWAYYRNTHPDPAGQAGSHSPTVQKAEANTKAATQT